MKIKLLFSAVIMAIAMTACTSDEVVMTPETAEIPISFNAVTNNMTRAEHSFDNTEKPKNFYVAAFLGQNFYFEPSNTQTSSTVYDTVTDTSEEGSTSSNWTNNNGRTWPRYGSLDFYAFLDSRDDSWSTNSGTFTATKSGTSVTVKINGYTVNNNSPYSHKDLMYAVEREKTANSSSGYVNLNFKHALSQICFQAMNEDPANYYEITSIQLTNVYNKGDFNLNNGMWDNKEGVGTYTIGLDKLKLDKYTSDTAPTNISNISGSYHDETSTDYTTLRNRAINLIPQTIPEYSNSSTKDNYAQIVVKFYANGQYLDSDKKSLEQTATVYLNNEEWLTGYRYIYTLKFKEGDKIYYDVASFSDFESGNTPDHQADNDDYNKELY